MGFLSGLGKLTAASIRTAVVVPVSVARDVVTVGGELTDGKPATPGQLRKVSEEFQEGLEDLGEE